MRARAVVVIDPLAAGLARLRLHPNTVTILGCLLNLVAGLVAASGRIRLAGIAMWLASSTDALDGTLARVTARQSQFGAFLDSTLDRLSEGAVLFGLTVWMSRAGMTEGVLLAFAALLGSVMVSYTRARAEGVGYDCKVGLFTRPVRVVVLGVGMLTGWLEPVLGLLAVFTWVTVVQRIFHVYQASRQSD